MRVTGPLLPDPEWTDHDHLKHNFFNPLSSVFVPLQINQVTHDQALVLQSALQNIPNPASECMLRNVAIRLAQQISDEVRRVLTHAFNRVTTASQKEYDRKRLVTFFGSLCPRTPRTSSKHPSTSQTSV
jgi:hypothetical protein